AVALAFVRSPQPLHGRPKHGHQPKVLRRVAAAVHACLVDLLQRPPREVLHQPLHAARALLILPQQMPEHLHGQRQPAQPARAVCREEGVQSGRAQLAPSPGLGAHGSLPRGLVS
ncbi:MAG: hypothetical protein ACK559_40660, partial [bacterium]